MPDWIWNESQSESGVVHQSVTNTDHDDSTVLKQGYDYANFSEITPDPVSCWPLHEDSGTTVYDVAGTNDGTYTGATLGQTGLLSTTAPSFDGTDDYADLPQNVTDFAPPTTISLWFYHRSTSDWDTFISNYNGSSGFIIGSDTNEGTYRFWVDGTEIQGKSITTGSWFHCVGVQESDGTIRLYFDGVEQSSSSAGTGIDTTSDLRLARRPSGDRPTDCILSDIRIYDQALTATQVQTLYDVVATQGTWTGSPKTL